MEHYENVLLCYERESNITGLNYGYYDDLLAGLLRVPLFFADPKIFDSKDNDAFCQYGVKILY